MYDVVRTVISTGRFEMSDILRKIDILWMQGDLTEEERNGLIATARDKADPVASYAPLQQQVDKLRDEVQTLSTAVSDQARELQAVKAAVEALGGTVADPEDPKPTEEWPDYVQPTGAHDAYHTGDKITWNDKRYTCIAPDGVAVVWDPDTYPAYWKVQEEASEEPETEPEEVTDDAAE